MNRDDAVDALLELYDAHGRHRYSEGVDQIEHATQCAALAVTDGAPPPLVAAALLHDVGHFIRLADGPGRRAVAERPPAGGQGRDVGAAGGGRDRPVVDDRHEQAGADHVAFLGEDVCEPIRLHVDAKRYLCAVDARYATRLSPASVHSLGLQGGPMDAAAARRFEERPHHGDAVRLRGWDDDAKVPGRAVPDMASYRDLLVELARRSP